MAFFMNEMTVRDMKKAMEQTKTVIIPVGVVEPHGYHLPLSTDILNATKPLELAGDRLNAVVAPTVNYCFSGGELLGTVNVSPNTFGLYISEICAEFIRMGFENIVLFLGHAGTDNRNALVVVDGSGSMYWEHGGSVIPAYIALSLGIYFAEHSTGYFANHFITFSETPQLVKLQGGDIVQKVQYCESFNEVANTDLNKVFALILDAAVQNHLPQSQLPEYLYIISDMEFDCCAEGADITNFEYAKKIFAEAGYDLPRVVFWNVQSRNKQQPVTQNEQGVALVSGCSPRIFSMLKSGILSPLGYMLDILGAERYEKIAA